MINSPLPPPIVFHACPVCGKHHETMQLALFGNDEDVMVNECCESCWQWFRMEEFVITINSRRAWAPAFNPSNPQGLWTDEAVTALIRGTA